MTDFLAVLKARKEELEQNLEAVEVPNLGTVWVRPFVTPREMIKVEEARSEGSVAAQAVRMVTLFCRDEGGNRMFTDVQEGDVETLFEWGVLAWLSGKIDKIINYTSIEDAKKN